MVLANSLLLALEGSSPNLPASEPSAELRWLTMPAASESVRRSPFTLSAIRPLKE